MTTFTRYIIGQALGLAAFNSLCNAAYTWWLWRQHGTLTLNGPNPIGFDLAATPAFIGLLSVLLGTVFIRKALANGRMIRDADVTPPRLARYLPGSIVVRALAVATLCAVTLAVPLSITLPFMGDGQLTLTGAVATKVLLTAAFSVLIVPLVIYATTSDIDMRPELPAAYPY